VKPNYLTFSETAQITAQILCAALNHPNMTGWDGEGEQKQLAIDACNQAEVLFKELDRRFKLTENE